MYLILLSFGVTNHAIAFSSPALLRDDLGDVSPQGGKDAGNGGSAAGGRAQADGGGEGEGQALRAQGVQVRALTVTNSHQGPGSRVCAKTSSPRRPSACLTLAVWSILKFFESVAGRGG